MSYVLDDILDVLSESTSDSLFNEYPDIFMEKLETNILDRTLAKTMTLYHGSNKDLKTIKPTSINMGTRLSKMRMSSFWAKDKEYSLLWALMFTFQSSGLPYHVSLKNKKIYTIDTSYATKSSPDRFKHVSIWLQKAYKKQPLFLYTLKDVEVKKVGRGQINIDEYTIDEEVTPTNKKQLSWGEISQYIEYVSREKFNSIRTELFGRKGKDASFIEKIIYRDGEKTMHKRVDIYRKSFSQYDAGIGNHKKIPYKNGKVKGMQFVPDLDSAKKYN